MTLLTEPFIHDFMQTGFAIAALIAAAAGALSCLLVLKGWSLMGDAIAHAVLPGVVVAYLLGLPLVLGAFIAGMACAGVTGFVTDNSRVKPDTVMGVVFSGMFGLGIVMYTAIRTEVHLDHILLAICLGLAGQTWQRRARSLLLPLRSLSAGGGICCCSPSIRNMPASSACRSKSCTMGCWR